jgi:hypothetical protein
MTRRTIHVWDSNNNEMHYTLQVTLAQNRKGKVMRSTSQRSAVHDRTKRCSIFFPPWSESWSELYRPSDHRLSAKLVLTFADRGCHVVSVTDSYSPILGFLERSRYFFFQVAPQLSSRGWVDPVPDKLLLRKNSTRASGSLARNSDH